MLVNVFQYDAIYLCETPTITEEGGEEGSSDPPPVSEPRMVLQTNCVKRRWVQRIRKCTAFLNYDIILSLYILDNG